MKPHEIFAAAVAAYMLASATSALAGPAACPLPGEKPMIETQLFFGRDIPGRDPLTDAEWSDFAAKTLAENFPDGFTVADGDGQWRNPQSRRIEHERSKIVIVAATQAPDLVRRLSVVSDAYRSRFHQISVGVVTIPVCASF
jgi:Protein of unknown function (DUF3574)